ncbi:Caleosin-domain-containing protein [Testicularia cyperi]|uniref:Caleosin-domain-containing protein n=1 Tax=Testicularia cyperi TaxID=1882483 RepID=A0A317XWF9_9BASI|nr:Caleosin-domain-containing protein [Testicularia cyperi]
MTVTTSAKVRRRVDEDPLFDNSQLVYGDAGFRVPYTPQNTWKDPNGNRQDYLDKTAGLTTMQKHIAYFDGDCDGVLWPSETLFGFLALGFGVVLSCLSMVVIHGAFSYPTLPRNRHLSLALGNWLPDPFMRIYVANIHRCKHGSDTESYDRRGQFRPSQFQSILEDYSTRRNKDALSFKDAMAMIRERRDLVDLFGLFAFIFEWGATYLLLWPEDGYMRKDDILGIFDGSIFVVIAHRHKSGHGGGAFQSKKA